MPTNSFSHIPLMEHQQELVVNYNSLQNKPTDYIPIVPRNLASGWPLLQISLFSIQPETGNYTPALGGGKCHFVNLPIYFLASLISKTCLYKIESQLPESFSALVHKNFSVEIKKPLIQITSEQNQYGRLDKLIICDYNLNNLTEYLSSIHKHICIKNLDFIAKSHLKNIAYSSNYIISAIEESTAVFFEGQIFMDLSKLLHEAKVDNDVIELFRTLFQVDKFNKIKTPELAILSNFDINVIPENKREIEETQPNVSINATRENILSSSFFSIVEKPYKRKLFQDDTEKTLDQKNGPEQIEEREKLNDVTDNYFEKKPKI